MGLVLSEELGYKAFAGFFWSDYRYLYSWFCQFGLFVQEIGWGEIKMLVFSSFGLLGCVISG